MRYEEWIKLYEAIRRDELAKEAMHAMISNMDSKDVFELVKDFNAIPPLAYRMADKMIEEGKK